MSEPTWPRRPVCRIAAVLRARRDWAEVMLRTLIAEVDGYPLTTVDRARWERVTAGARKRLGR